MNAKQIVPIVARLAPPLLIGIGVFCAVKHLLFSGDEEEISGHGPENANPQPKLFPIPPNSEGNPNRMPALPLSASAPVPASSIPAFPKIPVFLPSAVLPVSIAPEIPLPAQKKSITRQDMAKIFSGTCGMTRKSAVAALKAVGFGQTAAYEALLPDGRFSAWLQFAPDGIITWRIL